MKNLVAAIALISSAPLLAQTPADFQQDFEFATQSIGEEYAYFDAKATRWNDIPSLYAEQLRAVKTRGDFVALLEQVVDEIYDSHAQLNTNLPNSWRLVPSGTDLWAEWREGGATITQVRERSDAERAGIKAGSTIVAIDGVAIADAVEARLGRSYDHKDKAARDWALRSVLAGRHNAKRTLQVRKGDTTRAIELPAPDQSWRDDALLESSEIRPGIGYIRVNDSLGDDALIAEFDRALETHKRTRALIIDLRNTASGGNSSVARGIIGRFVQRDLPYQKHVLPAEERATGVRRSWLELVSKRGDFVYTKPVYVLVNRWTGSMGEGIALGFDATRAATVVGTPMAQLLGATTHISLPRTGIGINVPFEKLYHVNGKPREDYVPPVTVDVTKAAANQDPFVEAALRALASRK
jgi:C-terminal processing protease CtpA/Prc